MSSEGVAHTGGRYRSVIILPFLFALRHFRAKLIARVEVVILLFPCSHPRNYGSTYVYLLCNDPNQLSGMRHVIGLRPHARFITARLPKDHGQFHICAYPNTPENSRTELLAPFYHFLPRP